MDGGPLTAYGQDLVGFFRVLNDGTNGLVGIFTICFAIVALFWVIRKVEGR
jgi:hypothetical protein